MWTWTFQFVQFANLYHLLQRLVVHVVCGPVHVVAHAFVQVVKVFLWDHVVPVVPWPGGWVVIIFTCWHQGHGRRSGWICLFETLTEVETQVGLTPPPPRPWWSTWSLLARLLWKPARDYIEPWWNCENENHLAMKQLQVCSLHPPTLSPTTSIIFFFKFCNFLKSEPSLAFWDLKPALLSSAWSPWSLLNFHPCSSNFNNFHPLSPLSFNFTH